MTTITTGQDIVSKFDGKGSASDMYMGDSRIGKNELAKAGIEDPLISAILRNQGNGDGFLDASEFQTLLDNKIIALNNDQLTISGPLANFGSITTFGSNTTPVTIGLPPGVLSAKDIHKILAMLSQIVK